ncbi:HD domain-containing protein [Paracoccus luteus]|uniref:HD domain-containing protein n=1 Tax=Paracoccus luteus TaxID=2508543 RepID=UPI00106F7681|nr:HD domain-containing protein [Paracoccus luteus]
MDHGEDGRLDRQLAFLIEADRLKHVLRATTLVDGSRPENSGEHSWHLALYAMVLADQAPPGVSIDRVIRMLLIHDLVEIDAGDAPIHGDYDPVALALAEEAAADRIFGLLPPDQSAGFRALWAEFEAVQTQDAIFAKALDRSQPVVHILQNDGRGWRDYGVGRDGFLRLVGARVERGAPVLWRWLWARAERYFR